MVRNKHVVHVGRSRITEVIDDNTLMGFGLVGVMTEQGFTASLQRQPMPKVGDELDVFVVYFETQAKPGKQALYFDILRPQGT